MDGRNQSLEKIQSLVISSLSPTHTIATALGASTSNKPAEGADRKLTSETKEEASDLTNIVVSRSKHCTFTLFPDLPSELQDAVWNIICSNPRVIDLEINIRDTAKQNFRFSTPGPAFFYVNQRARRYGLSRYRHFLPLQITPDEVRSFEVSIDFGHSFFTAMPIIIETEIKYKGSNTYFNNDGNDIIYLTFPDTQIERQRWFNMLADGSKHEEHDEDDRSEEDGREEDEINEHFRTVDCSWAYCLAAVKTVSALREGLSSIKTFALDNYMWCDGWALEYFWKWKNRELPHTQIIVIVNKREGISRAVGIEDEKYGWEGTLNRLNCLQELDDQLDDQLPWHLQFRRWRIGTPFNVTQRDFGLHIHE